MKVTEIAKIFKALSSESRIRILELIRDKKLCVNAITKQLDITQPAVSQHLAILKETGLVKSDRYGSIIHYQLDDKRLRDFRASVRKHLGEHFMDVKEG
ncbi:MAG: metalloregulator ArsR/SmtB family transcription factor [bacterium]